MVKSLLAPLLIFATCINAESESFQKEVIASVKDAKETAKGTQALQYLSEKLNQGIWTFDPTPTPEQITSMKPRLKAKALLPNTATAYAPRWEVVQKQDAAGVCQSLTAFEFRTETTLVASDCPGANPKPNAFLVDESGLGSLEQSPTAEKEQRGFIVVGNLEQLSQAQSDDYFSKPQTLTSSSGVQAIALKFLAFVPDDAANPKSVKAIRVQAGSLVAEVPIARSSSSACGKPEVDNTECLKTKSAKFCGCYDKPQVMSEGKATLADGTEIVLVPGSGTFKVWKEKNGNRILRPTGLWASQSDWQKALTRAGTAFSDTHYTDVSKIAGRACPPNVFLDHNNMTATDRCLYYDAGSSSQQYFGSAVFAGTQYDWPASSNPGIEGEDWLGDWNRPKTARGTRNSYFEGNIKTCANLGMRLPTVYEITISREFLNKTYNYCTTWAAQLPTGDGISPEFAGDVNGVPSPLRKGPTLPGWPAPKENVAHHLTASATNATDPACGTWPYKTTGYWSWYSRFGSIPSTAGPGTTVATDYGYIRCVLP